MAQTQKHLFKAAKFRIDDTYLVQQAHLAFLALIKMKFLSLSITIASEPYSFAIANTTPDTTAKLVFANSVCLLCKTTCK